MPNSSAAASSARAEQASTRSAAKHLREPAAKTRRPPQPQLSIREAAASQPGPEQRRADVDVRASAAPGSTTVSGRGSENEEDNDGARDGNDDNSNAADSGNDGEDEDDATEEEDDDSSHAVGKIDDVNTAPLNDGNEKEDSSNCALANGKIATDDVSPHSPTETEADRSSGAGAESNEYGDDDDSGAAQVDTDGNSNDSGSNEDDGSDVEGSNDESSIGQSMALTTTSSGSLTPSLLLPGGVMLIPPGMLSFFISDYIVTSSTCYRPPSTPLAVSSCATLANVCVCTRARTHNASGPEYTP